MNWEPIGLLAVYQAICQEKLKKNWIITVTNTRTTITHNYLFDVPRFQSCLVLYKLRVVFVPLCKQRLNSHKTK